MPAKIELGFNGWCDACDEGNDHGPWKDAHEWVVAHNQEHHKETH